MLYRIPTRLILIRHAESIWNKENIYAGWFNTDLTKNGCQQTKSFANDLISKNVIPDAIYTSNQLRAINTGKIISNQLNQVLNTNLSIISNWQLNERHYGLLTGLNKNLLKDTFGKETVHQWINTYYGIPPKVKLNNISEYVMENIPNYESGNYGNNIYFGESLSMVNDRVIPYYNSTIKKSFNNYQTILIVSHSNTIRVLVRHIENIDKDKIRSITINNLEPIIYIFNDVPNFIRINNL